MVLVAVGKRALVGTLTLGLSNWAGCDGVPLALQGCAGTRCCFEWEEFGLFEFGVCLNEGQGTLCWKHREETEAPKCCV